MIVKQNINPSIYWFNNYVKMPISIPSTHKQIKQQLSKFITVLSTDVADQFVDGTVSISGYLRNGYGARVEITNLEEIDSFKVIEWQQMAYDSGAKSIDFIADFGNGKITFDVEYKRPYISTNYKEWIVYPSLATILIAMLYYL